MKEPNNSNLIYGRNPVLEALENEMDIEKVFMLNTMKGPYEKQIRYWAREHNVPIVKVPQEKLNAMIGNKAHQGTVAIMAPIKYLDLEDWLTQKADSDFKLLLLDGVKDVRNIGAIARSAHVFGMDALLISAKHAGQINEDTVKASAGAILQLPVIRCSSILTAVDLLQSAGVQCVATDLKGASDIEGFAFAPKTALIMGSEERGVDRNILAKVDARVKISQATDFDSLNVSVATGIALYILNKTKG